MIERVLDFGVVPDVSAVPELAVRFLFTARPLPRRPCPVRAILDILPVRCVPVGGYRFLETNL